MRDSQRGTIVDAGPTKPRAERPVIAQFTRPQARYLLDLLDVDADSDPGVKAAHGGEPMREELVRRLAGHLKALEALDS